MDRIDREILRLLQQRNKLSRRIGETKRRHGAVIYVPERERELLRRVDRLSNGKLPKRAALAIYREILSSSRAAQGQGPIGVLEAGAKEMVAAAHGIFGASSEFYFTRRWREIAEPLRKEKLALALLTGAELGKILGSEAERNEFAEKFEVEGDFPDGGGKGLEERIFVVTPRRAVGAARGDRALILIECKSTGDAVKRQLKSMGKSSKQTEAPEIFQASRGRGESVFLARLSFAKPVRVGSLSLDGTKVLGIYGSC